LRLCEWIAPSDPSLLAFLSDKQPDVMVASPTNLRFSEETDFLKAARRLRIPTAIQVLTWDNLSTKGLVQILPDRLFVWNDRQYRDVREIHRVPQRDLSTVGSPFFDKWFDKVDGTSSREADCRRLGLDPEKKILLYLGSSKNIAKDESWFIEEVVEALAANSDSRVQDFQILIRPHPANAKRYQRLSEASLCVFPEGRALPETRQRLADAALGINTSGMTDAVLADLPTFSVRLSRYVETQTSAEHFRHLERFDVLYLCQDQPALIEARKDLVDGRDPKASSRCEFRHQFARPRGLERPAGDVVAQEVIDLADTPRIGRSFWT